MTNTRSTDDSALGRCATITTIPRRARTAENSPGERLLALGVEIGIGFVKHDQEGLAVKRARQRNPLPLAGRQCRTALAEFGLVSRR